MKKLTLALMVLAFVFIGCAGGKFSAVEGELPADQIATIVGEADETANVSFSSVNGKAAAGAKEALAPAGEVNVQAEYVRGADKFSKELVFTANGGQTYKVGFRSDDVEYKMGSKETKHKVALYVKDASGTIVAGSDSKNDMEFAVQ